MLKGLTMPKKEDTVIVPNLQYARVVAPEALEIGEDSLIFPESVVFPLSVRFPVNHNGGKHNISWADFTKAPVPVVYSVALRKELPGQVGRQLRSKRTLMEGILLALAEKGGRRPSIAEQVVDQQLDVAESRLALGEHAFTAFVMANYHVPKHAAEQGKEIRGMLSTGLQAKGAIPQRFIYVAEKALEHSQPGGILFTKDTENGPFMMEEVLPLLPPPSRQVLPAPDAVWIGTHAREGRDVYYSFTRGFDPGAEQPPHATTLILGEMGSGKTTLMRSMLIQRLLQGRTVITLDPEGEYNIICEEMGGNVVSMGIPEDPQMCLLHPLKGETPEEMLLAAKFLISTLRGEPTAEEYAILHDAIQKHFEKNNKQELSVTELRELLAVQNTSFASSMVSVLRLYSSGGIFEGLFDRPKALLSLDIFREDSQVKWINFDLSQLREENRAVVYLIMTWFLYHAVTVGRYAFDIFIDEGWRLLSSSGVFRDVLDELGRRARKRGIGIVLTTHLPGDLFVSSTVLNLASNAFVGRLGISEAFSFLRAMGTPEGEARQKAEVIAGLPPRTFLAIPAGKRSSIFPVNVIVPDLWFDLWKKVGA